jgi:hypothetical protein
MCSGGSFYFGGVSDYNLAPLAPAMIRNMLKWCGAKEDREAEMVIAQKILFLTNHGCVGREFRHWCQSTEAPHSASFLFRHAAELLCTSVQLHTYSEGHRQKNLQHTKTMPHWSYWGMTENCDKHRRLDGFHARFDDPVWKYIYPPNGWQCGCSVLCVMESDLDTCDDRDRDLPPEFLAKCANWINEAPESVWPPTRS